MIPIVFSICSITLYVIVSVIGGALGREGGGSPEYVATHFGLIFLLCYAAIAWLFARFLKRGLLVARLLSVILFILQMALSAFSLYVLSGNYFYGIEEKLTGICAVVLGLASLSGIALSYSSTDNHAK